MNDIRNKLIELLKVPIHPHLDADPAEVVADYLIANGVTVQRWIPVTERLPEMREKVLILHRFGITIGEYRGYEICRRKNEFYWHGIKGSKDVYKTVTHWMPLPSAEGLE